MNLAEQRQTRVILDELPVRACAAASDGAIVYVDRPWCNFTGLTKSESVAWGWTAALHPGELHLVLARWRDALANGAPVEI